MLISKRAARCTTFTALLVGAVILAFAAACGDGTTNPGGTAATPSSASPVPTPSAAASTWPQALAGTWIDDKGVATGHDPMTIVIGESGGQASIRTTDAKGRFWDMVFTPTKMVFRASGWKKSVSAPMWRAGEAPFTGTYRAELPYGPLTVHAAYGDRVLVLSGSRIWFSGELIGDWRESFSSKDGITLTHYETALPHETMLYTRKAENQTAAAF